MLLNLSSLERESITVSRTLNNGLLKDRPLAAPLKPNTKALAKTMSFKILGHVIHNVSLLPTQKLVLIVLADFYNEESGKAWPSQDTLCMLTGLSRATLNRALKELKDKGHITIWKERTSGQYPHSAYRINHVSEKDMVEKVGLKSEQTMYQKGGSPCRTVRHYPLTTLKNTLDSVQDKEERIVGLPKTPEEFQRLAPFLQDRYWYHKPDVQRMLRNHGLEDLDIAKKGPAKAGPSLREKT